MLGIFLFSAQTGDHSGELSVNALNTVIGRLLAKLFPRADALLLEQLLRKAAHMFEYACLGIASFLFIEELGRNRPLSRSGCVCAALCWSSLYACTDEWHQSFVPGRSAQVRDVFIDSAGAILGVLLLLLIRLLVYRCSPQARGRYKRQETQ